MLLLSRLTSAHEMRGDAFSSHRFYVEACILQSYRFLEVKGLQMQRSLLRLAKTIAGIGDPLVAAYARCYLARIGTRIAPNSR